MIEDINNIDSILLDEDDRIVAYIKGEMSAEEEQQFFQEIEDNLELKEKAIITARLVKGLKQVGEEQDEGVRRVFLASSEPGVEIITKQVTHKRAKTLPIRKTTTWIAVAASVICFVWFGIDNQGTKMCAEYSDVSPFDNSSGVRGSDSMAEVKKLEKLFASVENGENLDKTIHELSLYWELSNLETANEYTDYAADIGWYLAIAYLKDNNKKEAMKVLEKMETLDDIDSIMTKKVRKLQEKL